MSNELAATFAVGGFLVFLFWDWVCALLPAVAWGGTAALAIMVFPALGFPPLEAGLMLGIALVVIQRIRSKA